MGYIISCVFVFNGVLRVKCSDPSAKYLSKSVCILELMFQIKGQHLLVA